MKNRASCSNQMAKPYMADDVAFLIFALADDVAFLIFALADDIVGSYRLGKSF